MATQWDASTISAVVALFISVFALLVTGAQALQQYFITGQLIRLCDSVVFGPLPGQGRRIWQTSQFRFRVVYSIPQISLQADLWPEGSAHTKSYAVGRDPLPDLDEYEAIRTGTDENLVPVWFPALPGVQPGQRPGSSEIISIDDASWDNSTSNNSTSDNSTSNNSNSSNTSSSLHVMSVIRRRFGRASSPVQDVETNGSYTSSQHSQSTTVLGWLRYQMSLARYSTSARLRQLGAKMPFPRRQGAATPLIETSVGEASWVSFCKAINGPCGASVRYDEVTYDADRCPSDLVTAPMQVSMRDIAVMGLMTGMRTTSCSFKDQSVSMQGAVGSITSSNHPILGPILHFTPRAHVSEIPRPVSWDGDGRGVVSKRWLGRTWDVCTVAGRCFNWHARRSTRRLVDRWAVHGDAKGPSKRTSRIHAMRQVGKVGQDGTPLGNTKKAAAKAPLSMIAPRDVPQYCKDGLWDLCPPASLGLLEGTTVMPPPVMPPPVMPPLAMPPPVVVPIVKGSHQDALFPFQLPMTRLLLTQTPHWEQTTAEPRKRRLQRQATVQDAPESSESEGDGGPVRLNEETPEPQETSTNDRAHDAKKRQAARNERTHEIQRDEAIVEESSSGKEEEKKKKKEESDFFRIFSRSKFQQEQAKKGRRSRRQMRAEREREREQRNESWKRTANLGRMDVYWFCQVDVYQGFWATPWGPNTPSKASLVGAIMVILEALQRFLKADSSLVYRDPEQFPETRQWISGGQMSYPAYAHNAIGGIVAAGMYTGVRVPAFRSVVPALELLASYEWQVSKVLRPQERYCERLNVELMRIDAWLSLVGRTDEISDGPNQLWKQAPGYVQLTHDEFGLDFQNIDLSAEEGGQQDIRGLSDNVLDFLHDEELNEAEQLYTLVALLRAMKVCQCVQAGSDTLEMRDILLKDVQAHLV